MKKKTIIISIFLLLIILTSVHFVIAAIDSYNYDMDPANGVDILEGVGAGMLIALGMVVIWVEFDLFFTVYYFLAKPKTKLKSIIMVVSQLMILLVLFCDKISYFLFLYVSEIFREDIFVLLPIFSIYVISRIICISICYFENGRVSIEDK